jgi:mannose-1-phosphate guanylyltransferase
LAGKKVKFKFYLTNGSLYSFWVSPDKSGASYGYIAAGGIGFDGYKDTKGVESYNAFNRNQVETK